MGLDGCRVVQYIWEERPGFLATAIQAMYRFAQVLRERWVDAKEVPMTEASENYLLAGGVVSSGGLN
jgi:hypothetical protein